MARVLIIEDEPCISLVLAEFLQEEGFDTDTALDGSSGLKKLREQPPPDVVLLDVFLPGLSGRDIAAYIRAEPKLAGVPVVLITGSVPNSQDFPPADSYQALISKPFDLNHLLATVTGLLRTPLDARRAAV